MSAPEDELAQLALHLSIVLARERQHRGDVVQLAHGESSDHLHSLGKGVKLSGLPREQDLFEPSQNFITVSS